MAATLLATHEQRYDGLHVRNHTFNVPLDYSKADAEHIEVFAREVVLAKNADRELPYLAWFQGGPGNRADRPTGPSGWLKRALQDYRVVLIDQRGTGLSSLINRKTLADRGDVALQTDYVTKFRADSIVRDAEAIRELLVGDKWSILGQSYGGFISLTYLSFHPQSLREAFITAGLPSLTGNPDDVYRHTFEQTARRCDEFFGTYGTNELAWEIFEHLQVVDERLLSGERLTPERFQTLGIQLGTAAGFRNLHYQLESAFVRTARGKRLSDYFLNEIHGVVSFARNPLYALLHESIYSSGSPTDWSAHRVRHQFPEFATERSRADGPFRFTGEMVFPWQFEQDPALVPLQPVALQLAARADLPPLYDQAILRANRVPAAAAVFYDDMYVPREPSLETAAQVGGLQLFITNAYQHDGIRQDGEALLSALVDKVR